MEEGSEFGTSVVNKTHWNFSHGIHEVHDPINRDLNIGIPSDFLARGTGQCCPVKEDPPGRL